MYKINNISFNYIEYFFDITEERVYSYIFDKEIEDYLIEIENNNRGISEDSSLWGICTVFLVILK